MCNIINMSSKAEICVGHAIGFINGHTVLDEGDGFEGWFCMDDDEILDEILSTNFEESESVFKTFFPQNIQGHSTTICLLVHQGKGLVWYFNPWGLDGDVRHHQISAFLDDLGSVAESAIENHPVESNQWARELPKIHIMFTLHAMKLNAGGMDRLEIINPLDSLPEIGPQFAGSDGIVSEPWVDKVRYTVYECSKRRGGSCAVWASMYKTLVGQIMSKLIHEQKSVEYIRNIVISNAKRRH